MTNPDLLHATATIVAGQAEGSRLTKEELLALIPEVFNIVSNLQEEQGPVPAVPIEDSVHDDYLVCLEDGERVVLLGRYLKDHHGMTKEDYIEKWGLPEDYPFVAKNYSKKRSQIAKKTGLGRK